MGRGLGVAWGWKQVNKPDLLQYDLNESIPDLDTQENIRREFTVLGLHILTDYIPDFKPFANVVNRLILLNL